MAEAEDFRNAMLKKFSDALTGGDAKDMSGVVKHLKELGVEIAKSIKQAEKFTKAVVKESQPKRAIGKSLAKIEKSLDQALKSGFHVNKKTLEDILKTVAAAGAGGGGGSKGGVPAISGGGGKIPGKVKISGIDWGDAWKGVSGVVAGGIVKGIRRAQREIDIMGSIFGGVLEQEGQFKMDMRDVAFVTQGITKDMRGMQAQFKDIGSIVKETGKSRTEFQVAYTKLMRRGVRDEKLSLKQMKIGLHTSEMVGDQAGVIGQQFAEWGVKLNLSEGFMSQINQEIIEAAAKTGVMGVELANVVKNSDKLINTLKNVGNLTSAAVGNVITLAAEAEKLGVGDFVNQIQTATASWMDLMETEPKMQAMLFRAAANVGLRNELMHGTAFIERANIKEMARGIEMDILRFAKVKSMAEFEKLSHAERMFFNSQYRSATGKNMGEALRGVESLRNTAKSYAERIEDIDKKWKHVNTTLEEQKKLERDRSKLTFSTASKYAALLEDAYKKGKKLEDISFGEELSKDIKSMTGKSAKSKDATTAVLKKMALSVKEMGGKDFSNAIRKGMGVRETKTILEKMREEQRKLSMEELKHTDPQRALAFWLLDKRDKFAKWLSHLDFLTDLLPPLMLMAAILGEIASFLIGGWLIKSMLGFMGGGKYLASVGGMIATGAASAAVAARGAYGAAKGAAATGLGAAKGVASGGVSGIMALFPKMMKMFKNFGVKILPKLLGGLRLLGGLAKSLVKLLGWPITILIGLVAALWGGFKAMGREAEIFGIEQDKVTSGHKLAAATAGGLAGILDFLTAGFFDCFDATGAFTVGLAKLLKVMDWMFIPVVLLWGVLKGIWLFLKNAFIGLWEAIKIAMEPVVDVLVYLWDTIKDAFQPIVDLLGPLFAAGKGMKDVGSIADVVAGILGFLGDVLGWVFKIIGYIAKYIIKFFVPAIEFIILIIGKLVKVLMAIFAPAIKLIIDVFGGLFKIFEGFFTHDEEKIKEGLRDIIKGIGMALFEVFVGIPKALGGIIGETLVGIWKLLKKTFWGFPGWLWGLFTKAIGIDSFMSLWEEGFILFPTMLRNMILNAFGNIGRWIVDVFTTAFQHVCDWIESWVPDWMKPKVVAQAIDKKMPSFMKRATDDELTKMTKSKSSLVRRHAESMKDIRDNGLFGIEWLKFAKGATSITRGGSAVVDTGEAIVPQNIAEGGESFNIARFLNNMMAGGGEVRPFFGSDMEERIQARVTGTKAGVGENPVLEGIEMASFLQVDMLTTIHEDLQTLITAFGDPTGEGRAPNLSTRTASVPTGATDYGAWQFGKAASQAGSQVRVSPY